MEIHFAYTKSENTKWATKNFIEFNDRINKYLSSYAVDITGNVNKMYVGILYLEENFFDQLEARKLRFSLSNKSMSIEVKIPLDCIEWENIEKLIIEEIIKAIEIAVKRKHIAGIDIIKHIQKNSSRA